MVSWAFGATPGSEPGGTNATATPRAPVPVANRCVHPEFLCICVSCLEVSLPAVQLVTTVSSAKIPSLAQKSAPLVVTTTASTASQIYSSLRPETNPSFLLAAAGKTYPLLRSSLTSHKHSSRRSRRNKSNLAPSNASTVPLLLAAVSWDPSQKASSPAKCTPVLHQDVQGGRVASVASSTAATGRTPVVPTQTPPTSSSSAAPPAGPAAQAVHK